MKKGIILLLLFIMFNSVGCKKEEKELAYTPEITNNYSIVCTINNDDMQNGYNMEEIQTFNYNNDYILDSVSIKINMDLYNDEAKEKLNSVIETYKAMEIVVNNNIDDLYSGMNMNINSTENAFEASISYDIKKIDSKNIDNLEFNEYIDNRFKFDISKYKEDMINQNAKCSVNLR